MATLKEDVLIVAGIAVAVLAMSYYVKQKAGQAADALWDAATDAAKYVNPVSDQNIAYQGSSALARWLSGQENGSLGTILYDTVHKAEPLPNGELQNYTPAQEAADRAATARLEAGFHGM